MRTTKQDGWGTDIGADGLTFRERSVRVSDRIGLAYALRDLINQAGDGELVGGRLEMAIAETNGLRPVPGDVPLYVTIGTHRFLLRIEEMTGD